MSGKRSAATWLTVIVCGALLGGAALAGCAGAPSPTDAKAPDTGANAPATTSQVKVGANGVSHIADWGEVYPLQTQSFLDGANNIEERDGDDRSHSHALLEETLINFSPKDPGYLVKCMACHSSWFKEIYEEYGTDALYTSIEEYEDEFTDMEFWDCRTCHEESPESVVTSTNLLFNAMTKEYAFPAGEAVCAQCHALNLAHSPSMKKGIDEFADSFDPYENGFSADGLFETLSKCGNDAALVVGTGDDPMKLFTSNTDEPLGLKKYGEGSVVDLEVFQGSNHQNLGMTCVSCHMPQMTAEDGTTYTSHDASGSPLENPVALEYCLTCHKNQGIDSPEAMKEFVLDREERLGREQLQLREELQALESAIEEAQAAGSADQSVLEEASVAWSKGRWYLRYTYGHEGENVGKKAAHNFDQMMSTVQKGHKIVQDAIDSLA